MTIRKRRHQAPFGVKLTAHSSPEDEPAARGLPPGKRRCRELRAASSCLDVVEEEEENPERESSSRTTITAAVVRDDEREIG